MIYHAPFYAVSKALYSALSSITDGLQWFDSSVPIAEIEDLFKGQEEFAYGIFGASTADCRSNKDTAIWQCSLSLEVYSNYRGRKAISQQLESLMNYLSSSEGWTALQAKFAEENYSLVSIKVGMLTINPPIFAETAVWQSGSVPVDFVVQQIGG